MKANTFSERAAVGKTAFIWLSSLASLLCKSHPWIQACPPGVCANARVSYNSCFNDNVSLETCQTPQRALKHRPHRQQKKVYRSVCLSQPLHGCRSRLADRLLLLLLLQLGQNKFGLTLLLVGWLRAQKPTKVWTAAGDEAEREWKSEQAREQACSGIEREGGRRTLKRKRWKITQKVYALLLWFIHMLYWLHNKNIRWWTMITSSLCTIDRVNCIRSIKIN